MQVIPSFVQKFFYPDPIIKIGSDVKLYRLVPDKKGGERFVRKVPVDIAPTNDYNHTNPTLTVGDFVKVTGFNETFNRPYVVGNNVDQLWFKERTPTTITGTIAAAVTGTASFLTSRRFILSAVVVGGLFYFYTNQDPKCTASFDARGKCVDKWFSDTWAALLAAKCHTSLQGLGGCIDGSIKYADGMKTGFFRYVKSQLPG